MVGIVVKYCRLFAIAWTCYGLHVPFTVNLLETLGGVLGWSSRVEFWGAISSRAAHVVRLVTVTESSLVFWGCGCDPHSASLLLTSLQISHSYSLLPSSVKVYDIQCIYTIFILCVRYGCIT